MMCFGLFYALPATGQGLGGAGTVQGTVKDPTGGVMQAVEVRIATPVSGYHADGDARTRWAITCSATCRRIPITSPSRRRDFRRSNATWTCGRAVPITLDLTLALAGATIERRSRRPCRRPARARSDRAHRHRPEPDRQAADRILRRSESGRHAGLARRRRRLERLLPSGRRPRADAVLDRQPADHRPAEPRLLEPDLAGRRAVDGDHHRRGARGVRRQEQPGRAHRDQVRASISRSRPAARRSATARSRARRAR